MRSVVVNGELWRVVEVDPGDPSLIDRTGTRRLATTDPVTRTIHVSNDVRPPLLDKVMLHEITHAITVSYGLLGPMRSIIPPGSWIDVEEWSASLMERHAIEAAVITSQALGRQLCVNGYCIMS